MVKCNLQRLAGLLHGIYPVAGLLFSTLGKLISLSARAFAGRASRCSVPPSRLAYSPSVVGVSRIGGSVFLLLSLATAPVIAQTPDAPTDFAARANGSRAALSWAPPSGGAPTSFSLYRGAGDACTSLSAVQPDLPADTTYFEDTTVVGGATYCYQVTASNAEGEGPRSRTAVVRAVAPAAPSGLRVTAASDTEIGLSWTGPEDNGGGAVDSYNVYRCEQGNADACTPEWQAWLDTGTTYIDSDVTAAATYRYAVSSLRLWEGPGRESPWSGQITAAAATPEVPHAPTDLSGRANGSRVALSWVAPAGDGVPTNYILYRGDGFGCANLSVLQMHLPTDSTHFEDTTVVEGTGYCYQVSASNAAGESPRSGTAIVTAVAPEAPTDLTVTSASDTEISLSWTAPEDNGGGAVDSYNVYRCKQGGGQACAPEWYAWLETGTVFTDTGVSGGSTYRYAVGALRLWEGPGRESVWSEQVTATAGAAVVPGAPTSLTGRANGSRAGLTWMRPDSGGAPISYTLYRGNGFGCANLSTLQTDLPAESDYFEDTTVVESGGYCYQITASNSAGESPRLGTATVTAVAPAAPIGLRVTARRVATIGLSWTAPEDNGGGAVDSYNVYRCEDTEGEDPCTPEWHAWLDTGTTYTDGDILQGTVYRYAVSALRLFEGPGRESPWSIQVTTAAGLSAVWLFPPVSDGVRQGFVRLINHSADTGEVGIEAIDDSGMRREAATLSFGAGQTIHFNSNDLEEGNAAKGFDGIGTGQGDWRLEFSTDLDIEALSYIRTTDGFLTAMHDVAPVGENDYRVVTFNPASNTNQVSRLRLVNPGDQSAEAAITGFDDAGASPGNGVEVSIPAGQALTLTSEDLESGSGLTGSIGDGRGKWRLAVTSERDIVVMSLLANLGTGHLTNLSTAAPGREAGVYEVLLFPAASDPLGRQGFVRVVNRSDEAGEVYIDAFDNTAMDYESLTLGIGARETVHFNSDDLELGNAAKGLTGSTGSGTGNWRLTMWSTLDLEVLSYIRTEDGFLTSMHDVAPLGESGHRVAILNPGSNAKQVSRLRLVNMSDEPSDVLIVGIDDAGASPGGEISASIPAGGVREYTAADLEAGSGEFTGALGDGVGKWRLAVEADAQVRVMSLLESPTGHLTNLSTTTRNTP